MGIFDYSDGDFELLSRFCNRSGLTEEPVAHGTVCHHKQQLYPHGTTHQARSLH